MTISKIGERGLLESFKYLDINGLALTVSVCKKWKETLDKAPIWQQYFVTAFGANRAAAFQKDIKGTWKEAVRYMPFLQFFDWINNLESNGSNPRLCVQRGAHQFKVDKTGFNLEIVGDAILVSGEKIPLIALQVDGPFAFGLRSNGSIIQWNFTTKKRVQTLQTFSSKVEDLRQFYVNRGNIYFREKNTRQIICYTDQSKSSKPLTLKDDEVEVLLQNGVIARIQENKLFVSDLKNQDGFQLQQKKYPIKCVVTNSKNYYAYSQIEFAASLAANIAVLNASGTLLKNISWQLNREHCLLTPANPCNLKIIFPFERVLLCYSENSIGIVDPFSEEPKFRVIEPVFNGKTGEIAKNLSNELITLIRNIDPDPKPKGKGFLQRLGF